MTRYRKRVVLIGLYLVLLLIALEGRASASMGPPPKWVKKQPAIPTQRAIIVHKDGQEQLIIESSLNGKGDEFAWIIPVPASPTALEVTSPGFLKTLSLNLQPEVIDRPALPKTPGPWTFSIAVVAWFFLVLFTGVRSRALAGFLLLVCWLLTVLFYVTVYHVLHGGVRCIARGHDVAEIIPEQPYPIGSYGLSVLDADTPDALRSWLGRNGHRTVLKEVENTFRSYIDNGWHFVVAEPHRNTERGGGGPHAFKITFACDQPVYPMPLTRSTNNDLYLELFVIADQRAEHPLLTTEHADIYSSTRIPMRDRWSHEPTSEAGMLGNTFGVTLGHPSTAELMWQNCMITKLAATVAPQQMNDNFVLTLTDGGPFRPHVYTRFGAARHGLFIAGTAWSIGLPLAILALMNVGKTPRKREVVRVTTGVFFMLVCLLVWAVVAAPLFPASDDYRVHWRDGRLHTDINEYLRLKVDVPYQFAAWSPEQIADFLTLAGRFEEQIEKPYVAPFRIEDSPGNFSVLVDERGAVLRFYYTSGVPEDVVVQDTVHEEDRLAWQVENFLNNPHDPLYVAKSRDVRMIEPIIGLLGKEENSRYPFLANVENALEMMTGQSCSRYKIDRLKNWWETNKDRPRYEWLVEAFEEEPRPLVAHELALYGDKRVIPYLGEDAIARLAVGDTEAVADLKERLGAYLTTHAGNAYHSFQGGLRHELLAFSPRATRYALEAIGKSYSLSAADKLFNEIYRKEPAYAAKVFSERLERDRKNYALNSTEILFDVLALSRATGIPIPMNYHDPAEIDNFANAVQLWLEKHPVKELTAPQLKN